MQINIEHVVAVVVAGIIMQGIITAVAFVGFKAETQMQLSAIRESIQKVERMLGLDGGGHSLYTTLLETASDMKRAEVENVDISKRIEVLTATMEKHGELLNELRRRGA